MVVVGNTFIEYFPLSFPLLFLVHPLPCPVSLVPSVFLVTTGRSIQLGGRSHVNVPRRRRDGEERHDEHGIKNPFGHEREDRVGGGGGGG